MGYQVPILKEYVDKYDAEVHIFHWDHKKLTPYNPPAIVGVFYYERSKYKAKDILIFAKSLDPDIVYVSGWMDIGYLTTVRSLRKQGIPVISGSDGVWRKTLKQKLARALFPSFRKIFFSHVWVPGPYQYEYVKRLGFKNNEIIFNCYCADIQIFNTAYDKTIYKKNRKYPHRFLYAGRLETVKGLKTLIQAWNEIKEQKKDWELCIIGNGSLNDLITSNSEIIKLDFMQPDSLVKEIVNAGCYILPSKFEPWALVLHEFSAAGLPIVCSDICGAAPMFVISKYNGYTFKAGSVDDLKMKMLKIINSHDDELILMSTNSHKVSQRITPEISAASFMSILG